MLPLGFDYADTVFVGMSQCSFCVSVQTYDPSYPSSSSILVPHRSFFLSPVPHCSSQAVLSLCFPYASIDLTWPGLQQKNGHQVTQELGTTDYLKQYQQQCHHMRTMQARQISLNNGVCCDHALTHTQKNPVK